MKRLLILILLIAVHCSKGFAQTILHEQFKYAAGGLTNAPLNDNVSGGNWQSVNGTNNRIQVVDSNLTYPGYGASGLGRCISMVNSPLFSEGAIRSTIQVNSGTLYCALLIKISDTTGLTLNSSTTGDYFLTMSQLTGNTSHFSRLSIRKGSTGNTFQLGLRANPSVAAAFATANLAINTTHLIVLSYGFKPGTNNDSNMLWINPNTMVMPAADVKSVITTGGDATDLGKLICRQNASGTPNMLIDGMHLGLSWQDIMGTDQGLPAQVNTVTYFGDGMSFGTLNWKIPGDYDKHTMQIVAFIKKGAAINAGIPNRSVSYYTASNDVRNAPKLLAFDSSAVCIYSGNSNNLALLGMDTGTTYFVQWYILRNDDSAYSATTTYSFSTQTKVPGNVNNWGFSDLYYTSARIFWDKPIGYDSATMTILVFLKQGARVYPVGAVDTDPDVYQPNNDFSKLPTQFKNDSLGYCIYKGDGNEVRFKGLSPVYGYWGYLLVVRKLDSSYYSSGAHIYVKTKTQPVYVYNLAAQPTGKNSIKVSFARAVNYITSTMTTVVFAKKMAPINTVEYPDEGSTAYLPNADFSKHGSSFQYDTSAYCVMNSDSATVDVTGLEANTMYQFMVYVIRTTDTGYSIVSTTSATTFGTTEPLSKTGVLNFKATGNTTGKVWWSKDSSYNDTIQTTLVFMKKESPILLGIPHRDPINIVADTVASKGSTFQYDTLATCVYNGKGTGFEVSGMQPGTNYYLIAYVVRTLDSVYSTPVFASTLTMTDSVSHCIITGTSATTASISWNKPAHYINSNYTTLVFVKADTPITFISESGSGMQYVANSIVGLGTSWHSDNKAYCVFRGDTNYVQVANLVQDKLYHVLIVILRDKDSMYSLPAFQYGKTLSKLPLSQIAKVNTTNLISGIPDSVNHRVTLQGIVYGFNQHISGSKFLLRDASGGITVNAVANNNSFLVSEGDSVEVQGVIGTDRGLCLINSDTIGILSSAHTLIPPKLVSKLSENTENEFITVNKVRFVNSPSGKWLPGAYKVVNSAFDTLTIQVLSTSGLNGKLLPATPTFNIVGIGSQISSSFVSPFNWDGYNIIPRSELDVVPVIPDTLNPFNLLAPASGSTINLEGNASSLITFNWNAATGNTLDHPKYVLQIDTTGSNFLTPKFSQATGNTSGLDTFFTISVGDLSNHLNLKAGQSFSGKWRVQASIPGFSRYSVPFSLTLIRKKFDGLSEHMVLSDFIVYPNPAKNKLNIKSDLIIKAVTLMNCSGQVFKSLTPESNDFFIELDLLPGIYIINMETDHGMLNHKIAIE